MSNFEQSFLEGAIDYIRRSNHPYIFEDRLAGLPDEPLAELHVGDAYSMCLLKQNTIAIGHKENQISIWDIKYRICLRKFKVFDERLNQLCAISETFLACNPYSSHMISIYDWTNGNFSGFAIHLQNRASLGKKSIISYLDWLITGDVEGTLYFYKITFEDDKIQQVKREFYKKVAAKIHCIEMVNETILAVGADQGRILLFDITVMQVKKQLTLPCESSYSQSITLLPNNYLVACCRMSPLCVAWDLSINRRMVKQFEITENSFNSTMTQVLNLGSGFVVCSNESENLIVFDIKKMKSVKIWKQSDVLGMALHPTGVLAAVSRRGILKLYQLISLWTVETRVKLTACTKFYDIAVINP
jgi:WD40 repeat protein